jgi:RNA polymerase sigma-70 factor (ECF subfamily)
MAPNTRENSAARPPPPADDDRLSRLYEEHVDGLYVFVFYRVGGNAALAEDVVQATFLQAIDKLGDYDATRGTMRTWLLVLSRNVIRQHMKQRPRAQELTVMWERIDDALLQVFEAIDQEPLTDEVLARRETRELVNMTIANLPDPYGAVLQRKYLGGESLRGLAESLALSEEAAKSLLARARRAFRETFLLLSRATAETNP